MGNDEAIKPLDDEIGNEVTEDKVDIEDGGEETDVEVEAKAEEAPENEVILDGEEGSQPDKQVGIKKRINKLNAKVTAANESTSDAMQELAQTREQNKLLRMALEQSRDAGKVNAPPDPNDFDDGVKDAQYVNALNEYQKPLIAAEVHRQTLHLAPRQDVVDPNLVKMQTKHYERADELKIPGFEEAEDVAIGILGKEITNELIKASNSSHLILYHLGKNPSKAEYFAELTKTNPVKATLELGALGAKLNVKPKHTNEPTPDPDDELQGGAPSAIQSSKHQRLVDKARAAASSGKGDMRAVIAAKKNAKAAGVKIT